MAYSGKFSFRFFIVGRFDVVIIGLFLFMMDGDWF